MIPASSSGWLLYRADEIQERDELVELGYVTDVRPTPGVISLRVCASNVRYVTVVLGADTEVLARKPRSYVPPSAAQYSASRPARLSPLVMPPFTGGRLIGDPLARPA